MGGISFIIYDIKEFSINNEFIKSFRKMMHRGSESTFNIEYTIPINQNNIDQIKYTLTKHDIASYKQLGFIQGCHRMSINDLSCDASQPFEDPIIHKVKTYPELRSRVQRKLFCNGEIYNYRELLEQEKFTEKDLQSCSDVEIILPLYIKYGLEETIKKIKGDYSFILTENLKTYDLKSINIYVVRDILGLKPLYMIKHKKYIFYMFVSEIKGIPNYILNDSNYELYEIPPGTYWSFQNSIIEKNSDEFIRYSDWNYYNSLTNCSINNALPETISNLYKNINEKLTSSVISRYNLSDRPVGILLSGGFDSSIILSILTKYLSENLGNDPSIYVFTIGELNEKEVLHSEKCVNFLEEKYNIDIHHHIISLQEISQFTKEIENAILITESFDDKTIRLSLPYLFLFKYISEKTKVKVLLTGEGLDELCGYKEFNNLTDEIYQYKSVKLLKNLSKYDLSRCDKIASYYKLELRHPFLDRDFLELILNIHPKIKRPQVYNIMKKPIEKYIIRKAFDYKNEDDMQAYLPYDVLWRSNDDITNSFIDFNNKIDEFFNNNKIIEKDYYIKIFNKYYPNSQNIIGKYWEQLWD